MERNSHFDSSWAVALVFGLTVAFVLGLTPTLRQIIPELSKSILAKPGQLEALRRPDVLVATANSDDQKTVAATVLPRGYRVIFADTLARASQVLQSDANRIGLIVIDARSRNAGHVAKLAQSIIPDARVIRLPPRHGPTEVATLLLAAI